MSTTRIEDELKNEIGVVSNRIKHIINLLPGLTKDDRQVINDALTEKAIVEESLASAASSLERIDSLDGPVLFKAFMSRLIHQESKQEQQRASFKKALNESKQQSVFSLTLSLCREAYAYTHEVFSFAYGICHEIYTDITDPVFPARKRNEDRPRLNDKPLLNYFLDNMEIVNIIQPSIRFAFVKVCVDMLVNGMNPFAAPGWLDLLINGMDPFAALGRLYLVTAAVFAIGISLMRVGQEYQLQIQSLQDEIHQLSLLQINKNPEVIKAVCEQVYVDIQNKLSISEIADITMSYASNAPQNFWNKRPSLQPAQLEPGIRKLLPELRLR